MHSTSLLAFVPLLASLASASPLATRQTPSVSATFIGAANAQYNVQIPELSSWVSTANPLSVSHIQTTPGSGPCTFFGVDGAVIVLPASGGSVDVGPPQTIAGGVCGPFPGHDYGMW
ncbi:hypothetical protein H2200_008991 [Cladophialophora chaetospira]|uniref:Uncharacterized protein n=1 Tax=Cladophialophora chaetospira TaxID=386627 RepID=A0AA38X5I3_9EURO|nr:hypothetical protein H2200_008991 [Cladophialophora chaetospira]